MKEPLVNAGAPEQRPAARRRIVGRAALILFTLCPGAIAGTTVAAPTVAATTVPDTTVTGSAASPLFAALRAADQAQEIGERQLAESHYRSALLEGWMLRAELDLAEGDLETAADALRRAAGVSSETRRPWTALGDLELRRGDAAAAVRTLRQVTIRHPEDGPARRLLAQALIATGAAAEAVQELEEGYASTGDLETAFALADGCLRLERYDRARELFAELAAARPRPQTWILIGRAYRDFRRLDEARDAFEKALELDPGVSRARYYLGTVELLESGRDGLDAAIEHFEAELRQSPDDPFAQLYLGLTLLEQRRAEEALAPLSAAARHSALRLDALRYRGRAELALGQADEAAETLTQALAVADGDRVRPRQRASLHHQLATALRRLGREAEARPHFAAAAQASSEVVAGERSELEDRLEGDVGDRLSSLAALRFAGLATADRANLRRAVETEMTRTYFNLGLLALKAGRSRQAIKPLEAGAAVQPEFPRLQLFLGTAYANSGRFAAAIAPLEKALAEAPDDELRRSLAMACLNGGQPQRAAELLAADPRRAEHRALQYAYGLALVRSDRPKAAEEEFAALVSRHGDWPELHVVLAQAHARQGDFPAARAALDTALALDPKVADAHYTRGDILLREGDLAAAITALRQELEHHPAAIPARYLLAVTLDLDQQPEAAVSELRRVLARQPEHADARYLLGKVRLAQGAADEAAGHLEAAARLAPEDANVYYQLALAYRRLGAADAAGEALAEYRRLKATAGGP